MLCPPGEKGRDLPARVGCRRALTRTLGLELQDSGRGRAAAPAGEIRESLVFGGEDREAGFSVCMLAALELKESPAFVGSPAGSGCVTMGKSLDHSGPQP